MKKKLTLMVSILAIAFLGFAAIAFAQETSVFGDGVLIRAYLVQCTSGCPVTPSPAYSAYLEVRGNDGTVLGNGDFSVVGTKIGTMDTATPANNTTNPVQIHDNELSSPDISISYDIASKTVYVMCIEPADGTTPHVMAYKIGLTTPVTGVCGSASGQAFISTPATNLCNPGTPSTVNGNGPWNWTCGGLNNGNPSGTCSASVLACGSSNGGTFPTTPPNLCTAGTASPVSNNGTQWTWTCSGADGRVNCSAQVQQSSALPDLTVSITSAPTSYDVGSSMKIGTTVRNQGTVSSGPFNVNVYQGGQVVGTSSVGNLDAGGSTSVLLYAHPNTSCAIHTTCKFTVTADGDNQVTESNEGNNSASKSAYRGR